MNVLKQIVVIHGRTYTRATRHNDIFILLSTAQRLVSGIQAKLGFKELSPTWLQERDNLQQILRDLALTGRVTIFSLADELDVRIVWSWQLDEVVKLPLSAAESTSLPVIPVVSESDSNGITPEEQDAKDREVLDKIGYSEEQVQHN